MKINPPYELAATDELWWCNSHQRRATHKRGDYHCCDPALGGILLPCSCVNLTDQAEVVIEAGPELKNQPASLLPGKITFMRSAAE